MRRLALLGCIAFSAFFPSCTSTTPVGTATPFGDGVPISGKVTIDNMTEPADVVRDKYGIVHIYARNMKDALRVEGYQVARDRTAQLELIRRAATGRLAEVLGDLSPDTIDGDIAIRTIGLARTAKEMYDQLPDELRGWIDAYADGISQFNARVLSGDEQLPSTMLGLPKTTFAPWTGVDVLAIARLQAQNLSYSIDDEVTDTEYVTKARQTFRADSTNADYARRAGYLVDTFRFAPNDPTTTMKGFPADVAHTMSSPSPQSDPPRPARMPTPSVDPDAIAATKAWRDAIKRVRGMFGEHPDIGSNNWIVAPSRTKNGHAMLANDPHLSLSAPPVFWFVHVNVKSPDGKDDAEFAGTAFPGIPGVILGFNRHLAWGATTIDYDVSDAFAETLTPGGDAVVFKGLQVPIQKVHETIQIAGSAPLEYDVLVVPHHGPILPTIKDHKVVPPDPTKGAISTQWTGHKATGDFKYIAGLLRAKNVEDARAALRNFGTGGQNWVFADDTGNIFWSTQVIVPDRDKRAYTWDPKTFSGTLPCFVLPGDGTAEWTGHIDEAFIPHVKNPAAGYVGTANADPVGYTLDNDPSNDVLPSNNPAYFACQHANGFRVGRIHQRIENAGKPIELDDLSSIQNDARSYVGSVLTPKILEALAHADEEKAVPGSHGDIQAIVSGPRWAAANVDDVKATLVRWSQESEFEAASGMNPDNNTLSADAREAAASKATLIFNTWLVRMANATLGDELAALGKGFRGDGLRALVYLMTTPSRQLATWSPFTGDSILFDDMTTPDVVESRDERILSSLLDAVEFLKTKLGEDRNAWRWGKLHTIRFKSLVSLWTTMSVPPTGDPVFPNGFPRHGDLQTVDVANFGLFVPSLDKVDFSYGSGPTQRFVIEMSPDGPIAQNVLPGGNVWDTTSPHISDDAELWRRNQKHVFAFSRSEVVAEAEDHVVYLVK